MPNSEDGEEQNRPFMNNQHNNIANNDNSYDSSNPYPAQASSPSFFPRPSYLSPLSSIRSSSTDQSDDWTNEDGVTVIDKSLERKLWCKRYWKYDTIYTPIHHMTRFAT